MLILNPIKIKLKNIEKPFKYYKLIEIDRKDINSINK